MKLALKLPYGGVLGSLLLDMVLASGLPLDRIPKELPPPLLPYHMLVIKDYLSQWDMSSAVVPYIVFKAA